VYFLEQIRLEANGKGLDTRGLEHQRDQMPARRLDLRTAESSGRNEAFRSEAVQLTQPLAILHIALAPRHVPNMAGVDHKRRSAFGCPVHREDPQLLHQLMSLQQT
jgi:hypothetical protein